MGADTEWRQFMTAKTEIAEALRKGQSCDLALSEIEGIAAHTEILKLRQYARQFLAEEQQRKTATA